MKKKLLSLLLAIFLCGMSMNSFGSISASQAGDSLLLFNIPLSYSIISLHNFSNSKGIYVRSGLPNFMYKAKNNSSTLGWKSYKVIVN